MQRSSGVTAGLAVLLLVLLPAGARAVDSGVWQPLSLASLTPPARYGAASTLDAMHARIWMFGGYDGHATLNDVWMRPSSAGATWTQVVPTGTAPGGRINATWIYDSVRDRLILFGGADFSGILGETWRLDLSGIPTWSPLVTAGTPPGARYTHAAVYDALRDRMLVFGGVDNSHMLNECWALDFTTSPPTWSLLAPAGTPPAARTYPGVIDDPAGDRLVLFGGFGSPDGGPVRALNDTWTLDLAGGGTWTQQSPAGTVPPARRAHGACYDGTRNRMIVVAGFDGGNELSDAWELDLSGGMSWSSLSLGVSGLTPRSQAVFAFDSPTRRLLGFGGHAGGKVLGDDLEFVYEGAFAAFDAPGGPSKRIMHHASYDPTGGDMYVFGGTPLGSSYNDVYRLHLDLSPTWTLLLPAGPLPAPRQEQAQVFDPVARRLVVYGGRTMPSTILSDVWQLGLAGTPTWSHLFPTGVAPGPRRGAAAAYDPTGQRMIVFGGLDGADGRLNDLRALSLQGTASWTQLPISAATVPSARYGATLIDDPVRKRVILFGGTADEFTFSNEVWAYDLVGTSRWSKLAPVGGGPSGRYAHEAVYDAARDRMVVFGGYDGSFRNDVWELNLADPPTWHQLLPSGIVPAARDFFASVADPVNDRLVLFGGNVLTFGTAVPSNDAWLLNWSELPVPTLVSLTDASTAPGSASLAWYTTVGAGVSATVQRTGDGTTFSPRATIVSDASGNFAFVDAVDAGGRYGYRLLAGARGEPSEVTWLDVPAAALRTAIAGAWPNPAHGAPTLSFTLVGAAPAVFEVFDVAGRRVCRRDVSGLGAGLHTLDLRGAFEARAGIYLATLQQGAITARKKFAVLP